jgi:hypothetical protein
MATYAKGCAPQKDPNEMLGLHGQTSRGLALVSLLDAGADLAPRARAGTPVPAPWPDTIAVPRPCSARRTTPRVGPSTRSAASGKRQPTARGCRRRWPARSARGEFAPLRLLGTGRL